MPEPIDANAAILRHRAAWRNRGNGRPRFALEPGPGQESVWDYPRPPRIEPDPRVLEVHHRDERLAFTNRAVRVLETASPPAFYVPPEDVVTERLVDSGGRSLCEWKGEAVDWSLVNGPASIAWSYERYFAEFESIAGWIAFYPARVECFLGGERVRPQPGGYYGGWTTDEIVGPVKGEPGVRDA